MSAFAGEGIIFDPILPVLLIVLLGALLLAFTVFSYWRIGSVISRGRNVLLLLFRILGIALSLRCCCNRRASNRFRRQTRSGSQSSRWIRWAA